MCNKLHVCMEDDENYHAAVLLGEMGNRAEFHYGWDYKYALVGHLRDKLRVG